MTFTKKLAFGLALSLFVGLLVAAFAHIFAPDGTEPADAAMLAGGLAAATLSLAALIVIAMLGTAALLADTVARLFPNIDMGEKDDPFSRRDTIRILFLLACCTALAVFWGVSNGDFDSVEKIVVAVTIIGLGFLLLFMRLLSPVERSPNPPFEKGDSR